ncbi:hypothetical protein JXA88_17315 [Candidatus Fermentibacteria bacterium]|nr:hypothetical protein [Candidatus Fermentibacteria bacterium]
MHSPRLISFILASSVLALLPAGALLAQEHGSERPFPHVSAAGEYAGDLRYMVDGILPDEEAAWDCLLNIAWEDTATSFVVDLGSVQRVEHVLVCVDNNDTYCIDASIDGAEFAHVLTIEADDGEVEFGIDCFASEESHPEYETAIAFAPVGARYIRMRAIDGDGAYAVGELQIQTALRQSPHEISGP